MSICETMFSVFPYSLTTKARIGCIGEDFNGKHCQQVKQEVGAEVVFCSCQWVNNKDVGLIIVRHVKPEVPAMYRNNTLQYSGPSQQRLPYLIRPQMFMCLQHIYFSLSPKAISLMTGPKFLANRVALLERDFCIYFHLYMCM